MTTDIALAFMALCVLVILLCIPVIAVNDHRTKWNLRAIAHFKRARELYRAGDTAGADEEMAKGRAIPLRGSWPDWGHR